MADTDMVIGATTLESTSHIPIAQLTPLLLAPSTRSVKAIVTLTWPYSSATGTVAFLLAEPDFRLRRTRGQVRVQFSGSSAKAIAKSGVASGDEVLLSLDGVEWVQDEAPFATPGRGVEFDLKFTERLLLEFRQEDSQETKRIDINHPIPENEIPATTSSPEAVSTPNLSSLTRASPLINNGEEWSSPAFIKRARSSYGSLFEKEYDIFAEDDGSIRGKGRKRTRLSSTWRYESRSPSPETEVHTFDTTSEPEVLSRPAMADEGVQTVGLDEGDAAEMLATFHRQATDARGHSFSAGYGARLSDAEPQAVIEAHHEFHETEPPSTQMPLDTGARLERDFHSTTPARKVSSPRLQPVSSNARSFVSPLIANEERAIGGAGPMEQLPGLFSSMNEHATTLEPPAESDGPEDLYAASPIASHGQTMLPQIDDRYTDPAEISALNQAYGQDSNTPEQYGQWQSMTAQGSNELEDHVTEELLGSNNLVQRELKLDYMPSTVVSEMEELRPTYPDPDEIHGQQASASWNPETVAYPDLSTVREENGDDQAKHQPIQAIGAAMSRSGSDRSAPVDLTESSDEGSRERDISAERFLQGEAEGSISQEGSVDARENVLRTKYRTFGTQSSEDGESEDDERDHGIEFEDEIVAEDVSLSEDSRDEQEPNDHDIYEEYSVEDDYEDDPGYLGHSELPMGLDDSEGLDEEEEDSDNLDEDIEDDDQKRVPQEPEVIDLLSSDDEDAESVSRPQSTTPRPPDPISPVEESDDSESDQDMEDDGDLDPDHMPEAHSHFSTKPPECLDEDDALETDTDEDSNEDSGEDPAENVLDDDLPDTDHDKTEGYVDGAISGETDFRGRLASPAGLQGAPDLALTGVGLEDDHKAKTRDGNRNNPITEALVEKYTFERPALHELEKNRDTQIAMEEELSDPGFTQVSKTIKSSNTVQTKPPALYSLDGAGDERLSSFPSSPIDNVITTAVQISETTQNMVIVESISSGQGNGQLPTPVDTQLSMMKEPSELLLDTSNLQLLQNVSDENFINPTLEETLQHQADDVTAAVDAGAYIQTEFTANPTQQGNESASLRADSTDIATSKEVAKDMLEAHYTRSRARQSNSVEPVVHEESQSVEEPRSSPRRSHRRVKSTSSNTEMTPPQKRSSTPKSTSQHHRDEFVSARTDRSSSMIIDEELTPIGQDASIQLAIAALDSPVKQIHDLRSHEHGLGLKLKLNRTLRTKLLDFTPLKALKFHLTEKLDILGVVTTIPPESERAKAGPRHYRIAFNITDHTIAPGGSFVVEVQVFRPYKDALPVVEVGDGILLRNFLVVSEKHSGFALRSTDASSWAVFKDEGEVDVRGPPVEYADGEKDHISMLKSWFHELDSMVLDKISKANAEKGRK